MSAEQMRADEQAKYAAAYHDPAYRMGDARRGPLRHWLLQLAAPGLSYIDVGCGRGESLNIARSVGLTDVRGAEVVHYLCGAAVLQMPGVHALPLPDASVDLVTCLDVLEHVHEPDAIAGLAELVRVTRRRLLVSVAWFASMHRGVDLHITKHDAIWWLRHLQRVAPKAMPWAPAEVFQKPKTAWFEVVKA